MFRSSGGVAGGWPGPHFFEKKIHKNEMQMQKMNINAENKQEKLI